MNISRFSAALLMGVAFAGQARADLSSGEVETVVVTGTHKTVSATKSSVPLSETPQNIQVLSSALIKDQNDLLLEDALRNVAGVMPGGYYNGFDYFRIRGFDAAGFIYLDNLKYDTNVTTNVEIFGLDQIEIVKGPASSEFGAGSLGGLVNLVSKRPTPDTAIEASAGGGSFGSYEVSFDGDTTLNDSGTLYGRFAATDRLDGSFIDYAEGLHRVYAAPSLTWEPDDATKITLLTSYQHDNMYMGMPLPAYGFLLPDSNGKIPITRFVGEPGDTNKLNFSRGSFGYDAHHRFNDWLSIRQNARYVTTNSRWKNIIYPACYNDDPNVAACATNDDDADARYLSVYPFSLTENVQIFGIDTALEATFDTGPIEHTLDVGVDYFRDNDSSFYHQVSYIAASDYITLDLFDPVYGAAIPAQTFVAQSVTHIGNTGVYAQEHAKWGDLTFTVGARWDNDDTMSGYGGFFSQQHDNAVTPHAGVTYEVAPDAVAYASYSQSFQPQSGTLSSGAPAAPEHGTQWEGGVKLALMDGRLNATASVYSLTRSNVLTSALGSVFVTETGQERSQGFELDSQAKLTENIQLLAAYSYTDVKVTRNDDDPTIVGDRPSNVPPQSLSLWAKYTFTNGPLDGLSGAIGGSFYSSQWGDLPNTFKLPSYSLLNANLGYAFGQYKLQVNFKNLLDERYAVGSYNDLYVNPGAPRSVLVSLTWRH